MVEYIAPVPAVSYAPPAPIVEYISPAPAVSYVAPAPVVENVTAAPAVYAAPAPVVEYIAPAPAVYAAPAPVVEYIAPAPAVTTLISSPPPVLKELPPTTVQGGRVEIHGQVAPVFLGTAPPVAGVGAPQVMAPPPTTVVEVMQDAYAAPVATTTVGFGPLPVQLTVSRC